MKIHEVHDPGGATYEVSLTQEARGLVLVCGGDPFPLPEGALAAVMRRYGLPFDETEPVSVVGSLGVGEGEVLRYVRHLARFDVIARDYLVYEVAGAEPLCAPATTVAGALEYVARATA